MTNYENFVKRMVPKPWGNEIIWGETKDYVGKILYISQGHRLSRQYHETKEETIMVISGTLLLEVGVGEEMESLNLSKIKKLLENNLNIFIRTFCLIFAFAYFTSVAAKFGSTILAVNAVLFQFIH